MKSILRLMRDAAYTRHDILVAATGGGEKEKDEHRAFVDKVYMPCFSKASLIEYDYESMRADIRRRFSKTLARLA